MSSVLTKRPTKKKKNTSRKNTPTDQSVKSGKAMIGDTTICSVEQDAESSTCPTAKTPKPPPDLQESATSFDRQNQKPNWHQARAAEYGCDSVMITNVLTDVKKRYHINNKE